MASIALTKTPLQLHLSALRACSEAREWAADRTPEQAWNESPRAEWLIWWAAKTGTDRKTLVKVACLCARTALPYTKDPRALACIEAAEKWVSDPSPNTLDALRVARRADAAADAAAAAAAAAAARSQAHSVMCDIVRGVLKCPIVEAGGPDGTRD